MMLGGGGAGGILLIETSLFYLIRFISFLLPAAVIGFIYTVVVLALVDVSTQMDRITFALTTVALAHFNPSLILTLALPWTPNPNPNPTLEPKIKSKFLLFVFGVSKHWFIPE